MSCCSTQIFFIYFTKGLTHINDRRSSDQISDYFAVIIVAFNKQNKIAYLIIYKKLIRYAIKETQLLVNYLCVSGPFVDKTMKVRLV